MDNRSQKKNNLSTWNLAPLKLQCPPPPKRLPNGLTYYPNLQPSSSLYPNLKDGMAFGIGSSLGKEAVNLTLLSGSQRENPEKNKCELLKQQIQECIQTEFRCNHLFESYLRQCSL